MAEEFKMMYFFRVNTLSQRNLIADKLIGHGFQDIDMTCGQAGFEAMGDFHLFCEVVKNVAAEHDIPVYQLMHCPDPGIGLFTRRYEDACNPETSSHPHAHSF